MLLLSCHFLSFLVKRMAFQLDSTCFVESMSRCLVEFFGFLVGNQQERGHPILEAPMCRFGLTLAPTNWVG